MSSIKQITLFGGSGFVGRNIVRCLAKSGVTIRVPTRDPDKALLLRPMGDVGQIVPIPCVLNNDDAVAECIGTSDVVINLIGTLFEKSRNSFQSVHVETAARIARCTKENGVRQMVHMSALSAAAQSSSNYSRSKAAGEEAVRAFFPEAVILRPSIVFGPEDDFFNRFASMARFSPVLPLIGGGVTKFQPVYVGDIAQAVDRIVRNNVASKIFEFGGPQIYSFRELLELTLEITQRRRRFANLPWAVAKAQGALLQLMPKPLLTMDQVESLKTDNVVIGGAAKTLRDFGITPTALEVILPTYLTRYRPNAIKVKA